MSLHTPESLQRALESAVDYNSLKDVRYLFAQGADPNHPAFFKACRDPVLMKTFLDAGAHPNLYTDGNSALLSIMKSQRPEDMLGSLDLLFEKGFNPNADPTDIDLFPNFPLADVLDGSFGGHTRVHEREPLRQALLERLVEGGADVNARSVTGQTVLMNQCQYMFIREERLQTLLDLGADVHAKDQRGNTALHYLHTSDAPIPLANNCLADLLVKNGADVFARNQDGEMPSHPRVQALRIEKQREHLEKHLAQVPTPAQVSASVGQGEGIETPKRRRL